MFKEKQILQSLKSIETKLSNLITIQKTSFVKDAEKKQNEETQTILLMSILLVVLPLVNELNGGKE